MSNIPQNTTYGTTGSTLPSKLYPNLKLTPTLYTNSSTPQQQQPAQTQEGVDNLKRYLIGLYGQQNVPLGIPIEPYGETESLKPFPVPTSYSGFVPAGQGSETYKWENPITPEIRYIKGGNATGGTLGQFIKDTSQPDALIKSQRGYDSTFNESILNGRPSHLYEIDHTMPLMLGGADTMANRVVLTKGEHEKKTKAQSVAYTLYAYKDINLNQARVMAANWKDRDISGISPVDSHGLIDINQARDVKKSWEAVPKVKFFRDVWGNIGEAAKDFGKGWLPNPVREFIKNFESKATFGLVPYEEGEDQSAAAHWSGWAGGVAGGLVSFGWAVKGVSLALRGMGLTNTAIALLRGKMATQAAEVGLGTAKTAAKFNPKITQMIEAPTLMQRFGLPLTQAGREAAFLEGAKPFVFKTLTKDLLTLDKLKNFRDYKQLFKDPLFMAKAGKMGAASVLMGETSRFVGSKLTPDIISGREEASPMAPDLATHTAQIFVDLALGSIMGIAPPTIKGAALAFGPPFALSFIEDPDNWEEALADSVVFGAMHTMGRGATKRRLEQRLSEFDNTAQRSSYDLLQLWNPKEYMPRLKPGESVSNFTKDTNRIDAATYRAREEVRKAEATGKIDSETALKELKRITVAGRTLYKGTITDLPTRIRMEIDDLLSFGALVKDPGFNAYGKPVRSNMENRFIQLTKMNGGKPPLALHAAEFLEKDGFVKNPLFDGKDLKEPTYKVDGDGKPILDSNGFPIPEGQYELRPFVATGGGLDQHTPEVKAFLEQKNLGNTSDTVVVVDSAESKNFFRLSNDIKQKYYQKELADKELSIDPYPENAAQVFGIYIDPKTKEKSLISLGWVASNERVNINKHAINKAHAGVVNGEVAPFTNHKDYLVPSMRKNGIKILYASFDPRTNIETPTTASVLGKGKGKPFVVIRTSNANWEYSKAQSAKLHDLGKEARNISETLANRNAAKYSEEQIKYKNETRENMDQNVADLIGPSKELEAADPSGNKLEDPYRQASYDIFSIIRDTFNRMKSPQDLQKMLAEAPELGMKITSEEAALIFEKESNIDLNKRNSTKDVVNILTSHWSPETMNNIGLAKVYILDKLYINGGLGPMSRATPYGGGIYDMPFMGGKRTQVEVAPEKGREDFGLGNEEPFVVSEAPTQPPVTQEPVTQPAVKPGFEQRVATAKAEVSKQPQLPLELGKVSEPPPGEPPLSNRISGDITEPREPAEARILNELYGEKKQEPFTEPAVEPVAKEPEQPRWRNFIDGVNSAISHYFKDSTETKDFGTRKNLTKIAKELSNDGKDIAGGWPKFLSTIREKIKTNITDGRELSDLRWLFKRMSNSAARRELTFDKNGRAAYLKEGGYENRGELDKTIEKFNESNGIPRGSMEVIGIGKDTAYEIPSPQNPSDSRNKFAQNARQMQSTGGKSFIPMGIVSKGVENVVAVAYEPKMVERFNKNPERYQNSGESLVTPEDKFVRAFAVDVLGFPKDVSATDFVKRANLIFHRYDQYSGDDGAAKVRVHILPSKKIGSNESLKPTPEQFQDPSSNKTHGAIKSFLEGFMVDGKFIIGETLYDKLIKDFDYDPYKFETGFKPLLSGEIEGVGRMIQKGHAIKADSVLRRMLRDEYGLELGENEIASFDTNAKLGPKSGTHEIPLSNIYSKPLGVGKEGKMKSSFERKLLGDDPGTIEQMLVQTQERRKDFEEFNRKIKESTSKEELETIFDEYAERYNLDKEKLFYGTLGKSFKLGAAKITLSHNIQKLSKNMFIETVLTDNIKNSSRAFISLPLKLQIDGPGTEPRYPRANEVVLGEEFIRKNGLTEGNEVIIIRDPSTTINNVVIAKVINGSRLGHTSLGKEHVMLNPFNERIKLQGDQDGDTLLIAKIGEGGVPESYAEAVKARGDKAIAFTEVKPTEKRYLTAKNIKETISDQLVGDDQTSSVAVVNRITDMLSDNNPEFKVYSANPREKSKYEMISNGVVIESGETVPIRTGETFKVKWTPETKQLMIQTIQEALDSKKSKDIIVRTQDNNMLWMLKQIFTTQDGKPINDFQARALSGTATQPGALESYQRLFNIEKMSENSKSLDDVLTYLDRSFKMIGNLKKAGIKVTPYQEKVFSLRDVERFKISEETKVKSDKSGGLAVRREIVDIDPNKVQHNPKLKEIRDLAKKAKNEYLNLTKSREERMASRDKVTRLFLDKLNKGEYTQEDIDAIAYWAAVSSEANISHGFNRRGELYRDPRYVFRFNDLINASPRIADIFYRNAELYKEPIQEASTQEPVTQPAVKEWPTDGSGGPGIHDGRGGWLGDKWKQIKGVFSPEPETAAVSVSNVITTRPTPEPTPVYNIRGMNITDADFDEAANIMFDEVSNRKDGKRAFEVRHAINTAINRSVSPNRDNLEDKGKTLTQVLQRPAQYQAYKPGKKVWNKRLQRIVDSGYERAKQRKFLDDVEKMKYDEIKAAFDEIKKGGLEDTTDGSWYYVHAADETIWLGKTQKEAKANAVAHEVANGLPPSW